MSASRSSFSFKFFQKIPIVIGFCFDLRHAQGSRYCSKQCRVPAQDAWRTLNDKSVNQSVIKHPTCKIPPTAKINWTGSIVCKLSDFVRHRAFAHRDIRSHRHLQSVGENNRFHVWIRQRTASAGLDRQISGLLQHQTTPFIA